MRLVALARSPWVALAGSGLIAVGVACGEDAAGGSPVDAGPDGPDAALPDVSSAPDVAYPDAALLSDIDGGPMCNPGKAFGAPALVAEVDTTASESSMRLSQDGLTAYFSSARDGGAGGVDLWRATRATAGEPFGAPQNVSELNSAATDTHASISADGLTLVFESSRGLPGQSVLVAHRASTADPFSAPQGQVGLFGFGIAADPFVRADGAMLYFAAGATPADLDIYRAQRSGSGYAGAVNVGELNGQAQESLPTVTPDDRRIYFASNRFDSRARGGFDIWFSVRATRNDPFSAPEPATDLSTADDDFPDFISPDGCTLWMHRAVAVDGGQKKAIYVASKSM